MMENCNYDRPEMMVFNIVRQQLLGEVLHAEGGYLHDLREIKFEKQGRRPVAARVVDEARRQSLSDARPRADRQLPRHQPRRSLRLPRLDERTVTRASGLGRASTSRPMRPSARSATSLGDVNTSLIKTARGKTVMVQHCTNLPRPYSRIHVVQGTKGIFQGYPHRLYIEGRGKPHQWVDAARAARRSSIIRYGRRSKRARPAPATAGWTSSKTTG